MEETKTETEQTTDAAEESRRDFITKAIGMAGAAMAGGLAAGILGSESAQAAPNLPAGALRPQMLKNGASMQLKGADLAKLFGRESLEGVSDVGKNMSVTLTWD